MRTRYDILQKVFLTEKSTNQREKENKVALVVALFANKHHIKKAVEELFKVSVDSVHTLICRGKTKKIGRYQGKQKNWKKAIVTLSQAADRDAFGLLGDAPVPVVAAGEQGKAKSEK